MTQREPELWIGLLQVKQRPGAGAMLDRNSAYVNAVAKATDEKSFQKCVSDALNGLGFDLIDVEDVEPIRKRKKQYQIDDALLRLATEAEIRGVPQFGTFHTWTSEDHESIQ